MHLLVTKQPPAKRAAIVEAQTLFVPYLVATLRRQGLDVVRTAARVRSRNLAKIAPDVLLVGVDDVPAPIVTLRRLRRLLPDTRIVLYTHSPDRAWAALARGVGADAVVGPADDEGDLISACVPVCAVVGG
jgi:DNA-binding NarL/FixJ family response regulator